MKIFSRTLFDDLSRRAEAAPRRRMNHNVHESPADGVQRFFNSVKPDTYIRPHRHMSKWEFSMIVCGKIEVLLFDDHGRVSERHIFGPEMEKLGFELEAGIWHTWLSLSGDALFLEIKQGPYDAATAVEFAPWAPVEGATGVAEYMAGLRKAVL